MNANDFAGSDFLKAADLGQATPQIQIAKVEPHDFGEGQPAKLVIHATDPNVKPVVLNVTNTRACIAAFGQETISWIGQTVMLSVRQTQMGPGLGVTPMQAPPVAPLQAAAVAAGFPAASPALPAGMPSAVPHGVAPAAPWPTSPPDLPGQPGVPFDDDIPI